MTTTTESKFNELYSLNVNEKTDKKNGLTYLTWATAWAEFKKVYPDANFRIIKDPITSLPYFSDPTIGIIVYTEVTVPSENLTYEMFLPVMDSSNKAMKTEAYTYQVFDRYKNAYVEKKVEAATMFDINKTLMRCLVKNLSLFGLGLYIYAGEDLPEDTNQETTDQSNTPVRKATAKKTKATTTTATNPAPTNDRYAGIRMALENVNDINALLLLYNEHKNEVEGNPEVKALFTMRRNQIQSSQKAA